MKIKIFDIGGTSIKHSNFIMGKMSKSIKKELPCSYRALLHTLATLSKGYDAVSLSLPSPVDNNMVPTGPSAVKYLIQKNITRDLKNIIGKNVVELNDANAAALAESRKGSTKKDQNAIFVVLGSGIGGGIILNNKVFKGHDSFAGEFGQITVGKNLWANYSPGEITKKLPKTCLSLKQLINNANTTEEMQLLNEFIYFNAIGLRNLTYTLNIRKIIIGGGVSENKVFIEMLREKYIDITNDLQIEKKVYANIQPAKYFNDANLLGAAFYYLEFYKF